MQLEDIGVDSNHQKTKQTKNATTVAILARDIFPQKQQLRSLLRIQTCQRCPPEGQTVTAHASLTANAARF